MSERKIHRIHLENPFALKSACGLSTWRWNITTLPAHSWTHVTCEFCKKTKYYSVAIIEYPMKEIPVQ